MGIISIKKILKQYSFTLLCILCFLGLDLSKQGNVLASETESTKKDSPFEISAECGFNGYGKFGRYIPVKVTITSKEAQTGQLRIIVPTGESDNNYAYEYSVTLEAGKQHMVHADIPLVSPLVSNDVRINLQFTTESGTIYPVESKVNIPTGQMAELFVGILSEVPDAYQAFQGINVGEEYANSGLPNVTTHAFSIKTEDITENIYSLDSLDYIFCDNRTYQLLTSVQKEVIHNWVSEGGVFLLEIPEEVDLFPEEDVLASDPIELRPVFWVQERKQGDGVLGYIWISTDEINMIQYIMDNREAAGAVIVEVSENEMIADIQRQDHQYQGAETYQWLEEMLEGNVVKRLPNIWLYIILIMFYIIIVGPVLFLILRNLNKAVWTRTAVFSLGCLFSLLIYILGSRTRISGSFIQYASVYEINGEKIKEETSFAMRSASHNAYALKFDNSYSVNFVTNSNYYYYGKNNYLPENLLNNIKTVFYHGLLDTEIIVSEASLFEPRYFVAERYIKNDVGSIESDLRWFQDELTGSITNQTGKTLFQPIILVRNVVYVFPDLNAGATVSAEEAEILYFSPSGYDSQAKKMLGLTGSETLGIGGNQQLLRRSKLLSYYLLHFLEMESKRGMVTAFLEEDTPMLSQEVDMPKYGVSMVTQFVELASDEEYLYDFLTSEDIINIDNIPEYHSIYNSTTTNSIQLEYKVGDIYDLHSIRFTDCIVEEGNTDYQTFEGQMFFYNPINFKFEEANKESKEFTINEIAHYLSVDKNGNYSFRVMYASNMVNQGVPYQIRLPMVTVIREK